MARLRLFKKRSADAPPSPPPTSAAEAYARFRSSNASAPDLPTSSWRLSLAPADAARGGPLDGRLDGWRVEVFELPDGQAPFVTVVVTPSGGIFAVLRCLRGGPEGDHVTIIDQHGEVTRHGPQPRFDDLGAWAERTFDMTLLVLGRHLVEADGGRWRAGAGRTRAGQHPPFDAFCHLGAHPRLASWNVLPLAASGEPRLGGGRTELWTDVVVADGPIAYAHLAAAYRADGAIAAIAAVETMPGVHDSVDFGLFEGGLHHNLGHRSELLDRSAFARTAEELLAAVLVDPPSMAIPPPPPPPPPPPAPPDPRRRLRELRDAGPRRWEAPDAAWLSGWLGELANVLVACGVAADQTVELRSAAAVPHSPDALLGAGWRLIELGLPAWAIGPLARAELLRPGHATTVYELGLALEAARSPHDVVRLYDAHPELLATDALARYQCAHNAAMAGDLRPARRLAPTLPRDDPDLAPLRLALDGYVARGDALAPHLALDHADLRGWHGVLTGGVLLVRSPTEMVGMGGRFGAQWESLDDVARVLDRLQVALDVAGRRPTHVLLGGDRDDHIIGVAVARTFGIPTIPAGAQPPPSAGSGLVARFRWGASHDVTLSALADRTRAGDLIGFGYWMDWTSPCWPAPDLVGLLAQFVEAPWGERMRMEPWPGDPTDPDPARRPRLVSVPADDRDAAVIGAEAAERDLATPDDETAADRAEVVALVGALSAVPEWVGCHGGARTGYRPVGPVGSSEFL